MTNFVVVTNMVEATGSVAAFGESTMGVMIGLGIILFLWFWGMSLLH